MKGKLFIISAPSGAGKTTLVSAVIARLNPSILIERLVTYTTRKPRLYEEDGIDYHFLTVPEFEARLRQGFFFDWSSAYGAYYGAPVYALDKLRHISLIGIFDRAGVQRLIGKPDFRDFFVPIWIHVPLQTLEKRLIARNSESKEQIERRLLIAQNEIEAEQHEPLYRYHIVNDKLDNALVQCELIIRSELIKNNPKTRLKAVINHKQ
jgi:guanylate kinase